MKNTANNVKGSNKPGVRVVRTFRNIRDPVVGNAASTSPTIYGMNTDGTGTFTTSLNFSPLGFSGLIFSVPSPNTAGTQIIPSIGTVASPYLPWLYNQSRGFERYRITRCTAIWVGNQGSNTTGRVMLDSSTDYADAATLINLATSTGGKVWDLGTAASKELRFPCDVDTSWKKVSSATALLSATSSYYTPVNSVNDLSFTTVFISVVGAPASVNAGSLFMEYDVEFKDPISFPSNV